MPWRPAIRMTCPRILAMRATTPNTSLSSWSLLFSLTNPPERLSPTMMIAKKSASIPTGPGTHEQAQDGLPYLRRYLQSTRAHRAPGRDDSVEARCEHSPRRFLRYHCLKRATAFISPRPAVAQPNSAQSASLPRVQKGAWASGTIMCGAGHAKGLRSGARRRRPYLLRPPGGRSPPPRQTSAAIRSKPDR